MENSFRQTIQAALAFIILTFSFPAVAGYTVSLVPNQQFATLAAAEAAMRATSPQASHLALNRQYINAQINYYAVPPLPATPATANVYGAPYYAHAGGYWPENPFGSIGAAFVDWWAHYQATWPWAFPGCNVQVTTYPNGSATNFFQSWSLSGTCGGGNYMSGTLVTKAGSFSCPADYALSGNLCVIGLTATISDDMKILSITAAPPIIPAGSLVQNKHVLTRSNLALKLQKGNEPAGGVSVSPKSNRGSQDTIVGPSAPTDTNGNAAATIETRDQPGTSVVTAANPKILTASPGIVNWFPAKYESKFLVTCYIIANEADYPRLPIKAISLWVPRTSPSTKKLNILPPIKTYRAGFLKAVKLNGSGAALNGNILKWGGKAHGYYEDTCARTSSTLCAVIGTTIAADPTIMPIATSTTQGSSVNVAILGPRLAQDIGDGIVGYHIDNYMGPNNAACLKFGKKHTSDITFQNY